eukprot:scaffold16242_cov55-Attheya_sp.AAC.4
MAEETDLTGLYVAVPIYFAAMACAAIWAHSRTNALEASGKDKLTAHYLGGRAFGPLLTAGTMFASLFSGYTVVGIPNEAYRTGWLALRWIPSVLIITFGYMGTGPRLRKAGLVRNHQSPADFMTDRYCSQILRYTVVFLMLFPSIIYLVAQVTAIKSTFNSIFRLDVDAAWPVILIMFIILIFEWVGGLTSVALTDGVQGIIMTVAFMAIPIVIKRQFGGWNSLDLNEYPKPSFYQNPSGDSQWLLWNFSVVNFGFFSLPHLLQRTYSSGSMKALKGGYMALLIGPWLMMLPGIFMGTVGVQILADAGNPNPPNPFAAILEEMMKFGGFPQAVGIIAFTSSLAGIMSTADSLIIAVSQVISSELVYPCRPNATPTFVTLVGKATSLVTVCVALLIGLFANQGISQLGAIQFAVSLQTVPMFLVGLFATNDRTDCHPWSLAAGGLIGAASSFILHFAYMNVPERVTFPLDTGVTGLVINIFCVAVSEAMRRKLFAVKGEQSIKPLLGEVGEVLEADLYHNRPTWDKPHINRFGAVPLTPRFMWSIMDGVYEPMTKPWYNFAVFILVLVITPLVPEKLPPLDESGLFFVYAPAVVRGMPWWAFKIIIFSLLLTITLLGAVASIPNEFPIDRKKIEMEGIDPNMVPLTNEELGRRSSYDEVNLGIRNRRSSIANNMRSRGLSLVKPDPYADLPAKRNLSNMVSSDLVEKLANLEKMDPDIEEVSEES